MFTSHKKVSLSSNSDACMLEVWDNPGACAVLFLPGSMSGPNQYSVQIEALRKAGFAVAAMHFTGHGSCPKTSSFTIQTLLGNIKQAELWLVDNGYKTFFLAGHSQGAMLALAHAAEETAATEVFALSGILLRKQENIELSVLRSFPFKEAVASVLDCLSSLLPKLPVPIFGYISIKRIASGARRPLIVPKEGDRLTYPLGYLSSLLNFEAKPAARCPVTLCYAPDDRLFTPEIARGTLRRYLEAGCSNVSLRWMNGGGHVYPFNPQMATEVAKLMAVRALSLGLTLKSSSWKDLN